MGKRLDGKRVLVTSADRYMGPAICELFAREGAVVNASSVKLYDQPSVDTLLAEAGQIDVLVANLSQASPVSPVQSISDEDWHTVFSELVHPLMRIVRAVVPQMLDRTQGKIVAVTSAAPLKGVPNGSTYAAARGAQNAFIRSIGLELARENIQVNAIAQNYVKNDTYYAPEFVETDKFRNHLQRNVPVQRLAEGWESAELALYLASDRSNFMVGQIIPFAGGWTTTTG